MRKLPATLALALLLGACGHSTNPNKEPPSKGSPRPSASKRKPPNRTISYRETVMADHPVAFWPMDDTGGTTAMDQTGHVNGTYSGSPTLGAPSLVPGDPGSSVNFDGTDDRILANGLAAAGGSWAGITFEAWVEVTRPVPPAEEHIMNFSTANGGHAPGLFHDDPTNKIKWATGSSPTPALADVATSTGTYYVAATTDASNVSRLYINGVLQTTQGTMAERPRPGYLFQIGADYDAGPVAVSFWRGRIDDVAVYNVALSQGQVTAHYRAGIGKTP